VKTLRQAGMEDAAAAALATLPEQMDGKAVEKVLHCLWADSGVTGGPDGRQSLNKGRRGLRHD
jgi:hypothetical protein